MENQETDDIDVRQILKDLLANKRSILIAVVLSIVVSISVAFLIPRSYESKSFFSFSSVKIPEYRMYKSLFEDTDLLKDYIAKYYDKDIWSVQGSVFEDSFEPVFGYGEASEEDVLLDNSVLGVYILSTASTPDIAQARVQTLGDYVSTIIVNNSIYAYFGTLRGKLESGILVKKGMILGLKEDIAFYKGREALISSGLVGLYNRDVYERQVVQVTSETEKYLPPHQQLVATRVMLNQINSELDMLSVKIERSNLLLGFVDKIDKYFGDKNEFLINRSLQAQLSQEQQEYFEPEKILEEHINVSYTVEGKLLGFKNLGNGSFHFMSDPLLPDGSDGPRKSRVAILIFFILLGTYMGFGVFMSWWRQEA